MALLTTFATGHRCNSQEQPPETLEQPSETFTVKNRIEKPIWVSFRPAGRMRKWPEAVQLDPWEAVEFPLTEVEPFDIAIATRGGMLAVLNAKLSTWIRECVRTGETEWPVVAAAWRNGKSGKPERALDFDRRIVFDADRRSVRIDFTASYDPDEKPNLPPRKK